MSFLKAEWRKLAIANYIIDKDYLAEFIPFGTELDLWEGYKKGKATFPSIVYYHLVLRED